MKRSLVRDQLQSVDFQKPPFPEEFGDIFLSDQSEFEPPYLVRLWLCRKQPGFENHRLPPHIVDNYRLGLSDHRNTMSELDDYMGHSLDIFGRFDKVSHLL